MITISIMGNTNFPWKPYEKRIEYLGVKKVAPDANPDILLIEGRKYLEEGRADRPVMLLDCSETERLSGAIEATIHLPQVKGVLKHSKYRFAKHYTIPQPNGEKHQLSQPEFEKIKVVSSYGLFKNPRIAFCVENNCLERLYVDFNLDRPIDVFFSGNVGYGSDWASYHRQKAIYNLMQTNCIKMVATGSRDTGLNCFPTPDFFTNWVPKTEEEGSYFDFIKNNTKPKNIILNRKLYEWTMQHSKIVFSPWGNGIPCIRDLEAILAGAVIIKPDSDFIDTLPNIYQSNKTYIPCMMNFSNLQEKIDMVLNNWDDYEEMRINNRDLLLEYYRNFPCYFANAIKGITLA